MADLPIPFSAPMVRALLREIENPGTGKTQTRRVIDAPAGVGWYMDRVGPTGWQWTAEGGAPRFPFRPRYTVGDRLYVREAWRVWDGADATAPRHLPADTIVVYVAGGSSEAYEGSRRVSEWPAKDSSRPKGLGKFRQGMHMPKWASRITLIVTDVRVQRLQEISASDCFSEGVQRPACLTNPAVPMLGSDVTLRDNAVNDFIRLWDSINGDRPGFAWRHNPWVVAYTFRPILGNIDSLEAAAA